MLWLDFILESQLVLYLFKKMEIRIVCMVVILCYLEGLDKINLKMSLCR